MEESSVTVCRYSSLKGLGISLGVMDFSQVVLQDNLGKYMRVSTQDENF